MKYIRITRRAVLVLVAILMIGLLSAFALKQIAKNTPTPTPHPTLTPTAVMTAAPDAPVYTVDPGQSHIDYMATGLFNAQFPGTFKVIGQRVMLIQEGGGYRVKIDLSFDLKSATALDSFMQNTLLNSLEVDQFPTAHLVIDSTDIVKIDETNSVPIKFTAAGTYDLHGHQRPVDLPMTLSMDQQHTVHVSGTMNFDLSDYGVNVPSAVVNNRIGFTAVIVAAQ